MEPTSCRARGTVEDLRKGLCSLFCVRTYIRIVLIAQQYDGTGVQFVYFSFHIEIDLSTLPLLLRDAKIGRKNIIMFTSQLAAAGKINPPRSNECLFGFYFWLELMIFMT